MTDRISDRLLERARLGELEDDEAAALIEELEATEGSTARLDALIAADAEFLERYPTEAMAPRIRERLRRARRAANSTDTEGGLMLSLRQAVTAHRLTTSAALIVAVVGLAYLLTRPEPEPEVPTRVVIVEKTKTVRADGTAPGGPAAPVSDEVAAEASARAEEGPTGKRYMPGMSDAGELVLGIGQKVRIGATGISRVVIDDEEIASITEESQDVLIVMGLEAGTTPVRMVRDGESRTFFVRVAEMFEDHVVSDVAARHVEALQACVDLDDDHKSGTGWVNDFAKISILAAPSGKVMLSYDSLSLMDDDATRCLEDEVAGWTFPETDTIRTTYVFVEAAERVRWQGPGKEWQPETDSTETKPTAKHVEIAAEPVPGWDAMGPAERRNAADVRGREAGAAFMKGQFERTIALCKPVVSEVPKCPRMMAMAYEKLGDGAQACAMARRASNASALMEQFDCPDEENSPDSAPPGGQEGPKERLSRHDVKQTISRYDRRVLECGEDHNAGQRTGTLRVKFWIRPDGTVRDAKGLGEFGETDVGQCVVKVVRAMEFPTTAAERDVPVTFPFVIR